MHPDRLHVVRKIEVFGGEIADAIIHVPVTGCICLVDAPGNGWMGVARGAQTFVALDSSW